MGQKGKSDFERLNNKEWLIQKYSTEKLCGVQIVKIVNEDNNGACRNCKTRMTVMNALRRFNIPIRGQSLSLCEAEYIRKNFKIKSKRQIAKELGEDFREDNGGSRNIITVRRFIKREGLED